MYDSKLLLPCSTLSFLSFFFSFPLFVNCPSFRSHPCTQHSGNSDARTDYTKLILSPPRSTNPPATSPPLHNNPLGRTPPPAMPPMGAALAPASPATHVLLGSSSRSTSPLATSPPPHGAPQDATRLRQCHARR